MLNFGLALLPFLLVHTLCDFLLQPDSWVTSKNTKKIKSASLYIHSLLHGLLAIFPILLLDFTPKQMVGAGVAITVSHFFIDLYKVNLDEVNRAKFRYFALDQIMHILILVAVVWFGIGGFDFQQLALPDNFHHHLLVALAYLLMLHPSSIAIGSVLGKFPPISDNVHDNEESASLEKGGKYIGYLERILIVTFALAGSYAAVGFVLTAKSIFRFGELNRAKDRKLTEYILLGSFLSVTIATVVGTLVAFTIGVKLK